MANYREDIIDIDLETGSLHRSFLNHSIGSADSMANRFGIRAFRNGVAETLTGSCQGFFHDSHGNNILINGSSYTGVAGNVAWVQLPQACYNYEGQFTLAIKVIGGGVTGTMRIVDGVVNNTNTDSAVAPTGTVPSYQEIIAQYNAMVSATEQCERVVNSTNMALGGGTSTFTVSQDDEIEYNYAFLEGNWYKFTNNTSATAGQLILYKKDGTTVSKGYIAAGQSITFKCDEPYVKFTWYANGGGSFVFQDYGYKEYVEEKLDGINGGIDGSKTIVTLALNEERVVDKMIYKGNTYIIYNDTSARCGNVYLIKKDGTVVQTGVYIASGDYYVFIADDEYVAVQLYANAAGQFWIIDGGINSHAAGIVDAINGGTIYDKTFAQDQWEFFFYPFLIGNTYTLTNGTSATSGKVLLFKRNGGKVDKGYLASGASLVFTPTEEYVAISLYANGAGTFTITDRGYSNRISGGSDTILSNTDSIRGAIEASVVRDESYPYTKKIYPQILVCTDIHTDWTRLERAFDYNEQNENSSFTLCMGDIVEFPKDLNNYNWQAKVLAHSKPILPMIGNHDAAVISSGKQTNAQLYEKFFNSTLQAHNGETHNSSSLYWYKDITKTYTDAGGSHTKKLRLIALNQFEFPDDTTDYRSNIWYSQGQITWLADLLDNTPSGTYVMIALHEPPTRNAAYANSPWTIASKIGTRLNLEYYDGGSQGDVDMLMKIVKAWIDGTSVSISNAQSMGGQSETITLEKTFSAHTGQFAGWICGHTHKDALVTPDYDERQKILMFHCTTAAQGQQDGDLGRSDGGKAQDCVTLVSYDWDKDKIRLVRLGADVTTSGALRQMVVI